MRTVERLFAERLPVGWSLSASKGPAGRRHNASWRVSSGSGDAVEFAVELVRSPVPRSLPDVVAHRDGDVVRTLVVAPFLSPRCREMLVDLGASFGDTTGNLRVVAERPAIFIERDGATKDPWPVDHSLRSLRGRAAGRAVRALVDFRAPFGVRDLAQRADVPLGSLSRTLDLLDREGLVTRDAKGGVTDLDFAGVLRRWSHDYQFRRSNQVATFLDPRGLSSLATKLSEAKWSYTTTGAFAAQRFTPIAPARVAAIYVDDIDQAARRLKLRPADAGANVVLAEPFDPVVFERTAERDDLRVVAASQLVVDLLAGPGREPSEGEELLGWMGKHQAKWRG